MQALGEQISPHGLRHRSPDRPHRRAQRVPLLCQTALRSTSQQARCRCPLPRSLARDAARQSAEAFEGDGRPVACRESALLILLEDDPGSGACRDDVARFEGHHGADELDGVRDGEDHAAGAVALAFFAVEVRGQGQSLVVGNQRRFEANAAPLTDGAVGEASCEYPVGALKERCRGHNWRPLDHASTARACSKPGCSSMPVNPHGTAVTTSCLKREGE